MPITVDIVDAGIGTAASGDDYAAFGTQIVTFPAGSGDGTTMPVTLTVTNDLLLEGDETLTLRIDSITGPGASIGSPSDHVVTITDDESPPEGPIQVTPVLSPSRVNIRSNGVIPLRLFGSGAFDVSLVNVASVRLGVIGIEAAAAHEGHFSDVNGDGFVDLTLHFRGNALGIDPATPADTTVALLLTGELSTGEEIAGDAEITLTPGGGRGQET